MEWNKIVLQNGKEFIQLRRHGLHVIRPPEQGTSKLEYAVSVDTKDVDVRSDSDSTSSTSLVSIDTKF